MGEKFISADDWNESDLLLDKSIYRSKLKAQSGCDEQYVANIDKGGMEV